MAQPGKIVTCVCEECQKEFTYVQKTHRRAYCPPCAKKRTKAAHMVAIKTYMQGDKARALHKAADEKYKQSEKGKEKRKAWLDSGRGKEVQKAFNQSDKGKAYHKAWMRSKKGKLSREALYASKEYKEYHKGYAQSAKCKAKIKEWAESDKGKAWNKEYAASTARKAALKARECTPEYRATRKTYYQEHKTGAAERWHIRRALKKTNGPVERVLKRVVFERDGYVCYICGAVLNLNTKWPDLRTPTLDHVVSLHNGGAHTYANSKCSCLECNLSKGKKSFSTSKALMISPEKASSINTKERTNLCKSEE